MAYNPEKTTWLNPNIEYLFNDEIIEYDMRDAGFSLIKQFKLLPPEKIRELERLDKGLERHYKVGMIQRDDKEFSKALSNKFAEVRAIFIQYNKLSDSHIVSVKKDAFFTTAECSRLKFGQVEFAVKHRYTSYIRFPNIQNIEIYYSSTGVDIKGMSENSVNKHRLYMIEFLRNVIEMLETHNSRIKRYLNEFIDEYKSGALEEPFYLEFNNNSSNINPLFNYQNVIVPIVQITLGEMKRGG